MAQRSWQDGQADAFEGFGGVPRLLVPDNAATATDRGPVRVTLLNLASRCLSNTSAPGLDTQDMKLHD